MAKATTLKVPIWTALLLLSFTAQAETTVQSIRNDRALLQSDSAEEVKADATLYTLTSEGKATAQLKVLQIKDSQAVALIIRGKALVGQRAGPLSMKGTRSANKNGRNSQDSIQNSNDSDDKPTPSLKSLNSYSKTVQDSQQLVLMTSQSTMSVLKVAGNTATTVNMAGTVISVLYGYQTLLTDSVAVKIAGGLQTLSASGQAALDACANFTTSQCKIDISYLAVQGSLRYFLIQSKINFFLGLGGGNYLPVNASSNALDKSAINNNQAFIGEAGLEYQLNRKTYIPISIEMIQFPSSPSVKAQILNLSVGYGWVF